MTTLQEQFEIDFPDKWVPHVVADEKYKNSNFTNYDLDLGEYVNLTYLNLSNNKIISIDLTRNSQLLIIKLSHNQLTQLDLSNQDELKVIMLEVNNLTSADFLNDLPNPKKLEYLEIYDNNILPTTLDFLRPFINLKDCKLGENLGKDKELLEKRLKSKTYNKFYGSLEPIKNLSKLEKFCIAGTDVEEGIEYIPGKIAELSKGKGEEAMELNLIDCQPLRADAKVAKIQNKLRPFNYDIEAWQLAHPHKMYKSRPEMFFEPDIKDKWLSALRDKINKTQEKLNETKQNEPQAIKRIKRLEMKLDNLKLIQENIRNHALIDKLQSKELVKKEDKATQTDLILEKEQKENQELKEQISELIVKNK